MAFPSTDDLFPSIGDKNIPVIPSQSSLQNVSIFTGLMSLEGIYFTYVMQPSSVYEKVNESVVTSYINKTLTPFYGNQSWDAYELIRDHYLNGTSSYPYFMQQHSMIVSDVIFNVAVSQEALARSSENNVFLYHFQYFNEKAFSDGFPVKASYHCSEFPYVFGYFLYNRFELNEADEQVTHFFSTALLNFIKNGNPSTTNFTWTPTNVDNTAHLLLSSTPKMATGYFTSNRIFYRFLSQKFNYDVITNTPYNNGGPRQAVLWTFNMIFFYNLFLWL